MNRKCSRTLRTRNDFNEKTQPSILRRRKRKAESDLETYSNESTDSADLLSEPETSTPSTSTGFVQSYGIERLLNAHPIIRPSPLPDIPWADSDIVWKNMVLKDTVYKRDHKMFERHPELEPRMRSILLDWLIEVCEVYKLHRETFYLAQDCIDRYLTQKTEMPKHQLQLLGITCLFIAAKVEEIYPPKESEFAYVTDGACTIQEIERKEIITLTTLDWSVTPVTVNCWLSVFLQVATYKSNTDEHFELQTFSGETFSQLCQLLDLCILDVNCLQFSYSSLAASAIAHFISKEMALHVSGFQWDDVAPCFQWMAPFAKTVLKNGDASQIKYFQSVSACDMHNIQTHNIGLKLLEEVQQKQNAINNSPSVDDSLCILTPPRSSKKCLKRLCQ